MSGSGKSRRWYVLSITVFLIGMLSIVLLIWVARVSERLQSDEALIDAVMDVQIHAATAHLWLEQAIGGDSGVDVEKVIADLDQAITLVNVTLSGGETEYDRISEPLDDPELRARAETIKSLLMNLKTIGLLRLQDPEKSGVGSVLDHQFDEVFKEFLTKARAVEDSLEKVEAANQEKSRRVFLGIIVSWSFIVVVATAGIWRRERQRRIAEGELLKANEQLFSQAEELAEHRERLTEMVGKRTAELTAANELLLIEIDERRQMEEKLRESEKQILQLSSRLITAQEIERKRIAMELHDELGQALNVTKLRIRVIEKGLSEDQRATREECEDLLEYMNHVIEDVRRLSLALSPTILEDLGLTSALRWLINNFTTAQAAKVTFDIDEIDHLFPRSQWITIYRVIQEALSNIRKHAQAKNVSVIVRLHDDAVIFSVEDDGTGFDLIQASERDASEKGLGLRTMTERMRMVGCGLDLWSMAGKGTRVTFSMSVGKGGACHGALPDSACR